MNIDDRVREIIREELRPVLAALAKIEGGDRPPACREANPERVPTDLAAWLTAREAAVLLGLSPKTLANWRAAEKGPAFRRIGRVVRYERAILEAYAEP